MPRTGLLPLLQVLPEAHVLLTSEGRFVGANSAFYRICGRDADYFQEKPILDFTDDGEAKISNYLRLCRGNTSLVLGGLTLRTGGPLLQLRSEGAGLKIDGESFILLRLKPKEAATAQFRVLNQKIQELREEVLERRKTEFALRQQRSWFAVTLSSIGDAVITTDERARITFLNPAAVEMTGWTLEEATGRPLLEVFRIVNEKTREMAFNPVARVLQDGAIVGLANHTALIRRDGREISIEDSAAPIRDAANNICGVVMVFHDVTDRRLAQKKLSQHAENLERQVAERTAHLRETIQSLEGVCYTMAHDLRSPLRSIQGFTSILLDDYAPSFDETGRDLAARIAKSAARMDALIHDLLEFAKLSHVEVPCEKLDLGQVVEDVIGNAALEIEARGAKIAISGSLKEAKANKTLTGQILANVIGNALKFVESGTVPRIEVKTERRNGFVRLSIQDNGIGIEPEHQARVFEIFHRLHKDERKFPGTGVGLAIVKKGMERMGGRVELDSILGMGTCFHLDFKPID